MKNKFTIEVTDRRLFKLQAIANSKNIDVQSLLYCALDDYERANEPDANRKTYKL